MLRNRKARPARARSARPERVVVGSTAPQKIGPGGVVTKCRSCGTECLIDSEGVRDLGRWPTAVVWCDACESKWVTEEAKEHPVQLADVTDAFEFDPPWVADEVRKNERMGPGLQRTYTWTNSEKEPVMITRKADGHTFLLAKHDQLNLTLDVAVPTMVDALDFHKTGR